MGLRVPQENMDALLVKFCLQREEPYDDAAIEAVAQLIMDSTGVQAKILGMEPSLLGGKDKQWLKFKVLGAFKPRSSPHDADNFLATCTAHLERAGHSVVDSLAEALDALAAALAERDTHAYGEELFSPRCALPCASSPPP
jgi:hypothetical protein